MDERVYCLRCATLCERQTEGEDTVWICTRKHGAQKRVKGGAAAKPAAQATQEEGAA